jgi:NitT/TauT family transport system permease protein
MKMQDRKRKRLLVLTRALSVGQDALAALKQRYDIATIPTLADLQAALQRTNKADALVMADDLHLDISEDADAAAASRFMERVHAGAFSLPVILVARTRELPLNAFSRRTRVHGIAGRRDIQLVTSSSDPDALIDAVDVALTRKHHRLLKKVRVAAPPIFVFLALLLLWEGACRVFRVREFVLPLPSKVLAVTIENASSLFLDATWTTVEAVLGFLLANVLSIIVAVAFSHSRWMEASLYPYAIALKSVPIVAIAPLLVLWFGYGLWGKVVMAAMVAFFPLVVNATLGLKSVNSESLDLMRSLSATPWQILVKLRFPTSVPYIISALKISSTMAVIGAIVGELAGATRGIGYLILVSSYNLDTPLLFAAIALASLIGIVFFAGLAALEMVAAKYYAASEGRQTS